MVAFSSSAGVESNHPIMPIFTEWEGTGLASKKRSEDGMRSNTHTRGLDPTGWSH